MSQRSVGGCPTSSISTSSSFPISSPSFWEEAVKAASPTNIQDTATPIQQSADQFEDFGKNDGVEEKMVDKGDGLMKVAVNIKEALEARERAEIGPVSQSSRPKKRARFDHEKEFPKIDKEIDDIERQDHKAIRTSLSYLPNRRESLDPSNPHAYLANPEYAPNRFGDIGDYMRKKEIKVQNQNRDIALSSLSSKTLPQIFTDISFYINGNTHPPMEELRKMILQRGGEVRPVLRNKGMVKFIIAPMLTMAKFKEFERYRVVREGWIVESCKEGKLLDWSRWKLQIQGGWEETGRKGLQGFLTGTAQSNKTEVQIDDNAENEQKGDKRGEMVAGVEDEVGSISKESVLPTSPPLRSSPPDRPHNPTANPSASIQNLLRPIQPNPIRINPGAPSAKSTHPRPHTSPAPSKVQQPEGWWADYHTGRPNDEAARMLRNSEWRSKNTAERGNENGYIDGYYKNSRLHHLSTWKSELRVLVAEAQRQSESIALTKPSASSIPATSTLSLSKASLPRLGGLVDREQNNEKVIFHVDFDAFFVSCGLATRPELRGKPVVVCHSMAKGENSTSEIASASYEARAKGVKNGMSLGRATQLVGKDLQTIPYEFETYKKFSLAFYTVLMGYADQLQAVSVDEALIDVTTAVATRELEPQEPTNDEGYSDQAPRDPAVELADKIRSDVRNETGCEVSIGIAHNILLAKLATRRAKPAGVYHIFPSTIPEFLSQLDVDELPSIGYSIKSRIEEKFNTTKCGELLSISKDAFKKLLGPKTGEMVWGYLRGVDNRKLELDKERKSVSAEMNYGIRFQTQEQAETCVRDLAAEVAKRMRQVNVRGRLLTLKLMTRHPDAPIEPPKFLGHGLCETTNRSAPISNKNSTATDDPIVLGNESVKLLRAMRLDPIEMRGVGIQVTKLDSDSSGSSSSSSKTEKDPGQGVLQFRFAPAPMRPSAHVPVAGEIPASVTATTTMRKYSEEIIPVHANFDPADNVQVIDVFPSPSPPGPRSPTPTPVAGPSRILVPSASSEGIDPEFLAALPSDLREEVKRDHAQARAAARSKTKTGDQLVVDDDDDDNDDHAVMELDNEGSPAKTPTKRNGKHAAAHITRQLRPNLKTQMKATTIAQLPLYGAWSKAGLNNDEYQQFATKDLNMFELDDKYGKIGNFQISELKDLGLDPEVFEQLPEDVQVEVISQERQRQRQRKLLYRPADTSRVRARERQRERDGTTSASPFSNRAGSVGPFTNLVGAGSRMGEGDTRIARSTRPPPSIIRPNPSCPTLFAARTSEEVMITIRKWIESRVEIGSAPASKDAAKVGAYLMKCLGPEGGLGGLNDAVDVLKYMRIVLREVIGSDEEAGQREAENKEVDMDGERRWNEREIDKEEEVRRAWWAIWWGFKKEMDRIAISTIGAPLKL